MYIIYSNTKCISLPDSSDILTHVKLINHVRLINHISLLRLLPIGELLLCVK